ncbi:hypothetical protein NFC73_02795 [Pseudarthrobacter sp. RMG13]|uniref:DUF6798 domain-containing protein n=1 Tax=Pseudarthrobacter humi TaxID=2952523 RepID=A0ABT1LLG9_9MICC|nr:DUF6798 domain-containing protein [Pseudarthrobacter humi]MCP8998666.1 hypothetical protein [Pseudarthrobacter humi]
MGILINFGNQGRGGYMPGGYNAGNSDHLVLSTLGIHWADPTKFAGDWFMEASPQPHWFFDIITFLGASAGNLGAAYFVFWVAGLVSFGFATAILSKHWAPNHPWLLGLAVTFLMSVAPWSSVGTGNAMIAFAVPAVVGGHMVYLFLAYLNTGRFTAAAVVAPLIAVVHVQQGAVICIFLIAVSTIKWFTRDRSESLGRSLWVAGLSSLFVTGAIVVFGLTFRPIAAKLQDFVEICDVMIPYHCAAHLWDLPLVYSSLAIILLSLLTWSFVGTKDRWIWTATVGLAGVGLALGLLMDNMHVPVLGPLFQGTNVYRLGAVVFPFAIFGILVGLFRAGWNWRGAAMAQASFFALFLYLGQFAWQLKHATSPKFVLPLVVVTAAVIYIRSHRGRGLGPWAFRAGVLAFVGLFALNAVAAHAFTPRGLNTTFISNADLKAWGKKVEATVPPGEQLLAAPQWIVKTPSGRGVVADCKDVPYGGAPWQEWQQRISDLGGIDQCKLPYSQTYLSMSAQELDSAAAKYSVEYAVLDISQKDKFEDLGKLGWHEVLEPFNDINYYVLSKK